MDFNGLVTDVHVLLLTFISFPSNPDLIDLVLHVCVSVCLLHASVAEHALHVHMKFHCYLFLVSDGCPLLAFDMFSLSVFSLALFLSAKGTKPHPSAQGHCVSYNRNPNGLVRVSPGTATTGGAPGTLLLQAQARSV